MSSSAFWMIILMMFMGGVVAYLGDIIGRKLGKKRLRLGKLRPRHTAIFFTVLVGALIPLATTWAVSTISANVRQWIAQGTALVESNKKLEQEKNALLTETQTLNQQVSNMRELATSLETNIEKQEKKLTETEHTLTQALERENTALNRVEQLKLQETDLRKRNDSLREQLDEKTSEIEAAEIEIKRIKQEIEETNQESLRVTQEIQRIERQLSLTTEELNTKEKQIMETEIRYSDMLGRIGDLRVEEQALRRNIESLIKERDTLIQGIEALSITIETVRIGQLIFHRGEELARLVVPPRIGETVARRMLNDLLRASHLTALQRGVSPDRQGRSAAMNEILRRMPDGTTQRITVEEQINEVVNAITNSQEESVLTSNAFYNYFREDMLNNLPVPLEIEVFKNNVVFHEGDIVATTLIDGSKNEDEITSQVIRFVNQEVRTRAHASGMISTYRQNEALSAISPSDLANLVNQIRRQRRVVSLEAVAKSTIKASQVLDLSFRIKRIE